ncbi:MAG: hypothetical protein KJO69_05680, partial [Gammaproteobacteria bacterium]|nr:hypothetical protein [Gammaproteobacteria bacterium]
TADQIIAKLGASEDFQRSGIERLYFLTRIQFESIQKPNGQLIIRLTTKEAVKEPFLNFLVSLEWPNGRLLREYTVLLDPPIFDDTPNTVVTPVETQRPSTQAPRRTQVQPEMTEPAYDGDVYGLTTSSDTLWSIAKKVRPNSSVSVHRAMVALYDANPDAFMRGNINRLKRGAEIKIPSQQAFDQVTQREALRLIREHEESWRSGKAVSRRVMDASTPERDTRRPATNGDTQSGRLQLATEEQTQTGTGGSNAALTEEENLILKEQKQALEDKAQADRERIENLERLLKLKNEQLATLQQNSNELQDVEDAQLTPEATEDTTETAKTAEEMKPTPAEPVKTEPAKPEPSIVDNLMAGAYNLYLGILALIALVAFFIMRARSNTDVSYSDAIQPNTPERKVTPKGLTADDIPDTADEILADTDDYEAVPNEPSDDSDPVGEADIYMAYGKFDQAEGLLLTSIEAAPNRTELHTKLLECYAEMGDKDKFEAHLSNIEETIDADNELSSIVQELYQSSWPAGSYYTYDDTLAEFDEVAEEEVALDIDTEEVLDDTEEVLDDAEAVIDDAEELGEIDELEDLPSTEDVFGEVEDVDEIADELNFETESDLDEGSDESVDDSEEADVSEDDIDTQLDLAQAYVEMGDYEGAREIAEEVVENGTAAQKSKAQEILKSIDN